MMAFGVWDTLAMVFGAALLLLIGIFTIVFLSYREKHVDELRAIEENNNHSYEINEFPVEDVSSWEPSNNIVFFDSNINYDDSDFVRASTEILRTGGNMGMTLKVIFDDSTTMVVKRMSDVNMPEPMFRQQLELIRRVGRHQNVAAIQGYRYRRDDDKLLIYEYYSAGSLHDAFLGNTREFTWHDRLKVARGTAKAIKHVHSAGGPTFTLGNICSFNILLDQEMEAHVTDIGLLYLNMDYRDFNANGFEAPEVKSRQDYTQKSDIYSFGVVLFELLTRKDAFAYTQNEGLGLVEWVSRTLFGPNGYNTVLDIQLTSFSQTKELRDMFRIAWLCVAKNVDSRPPITEVLKALGC